MPEHETEMDFLHKLFGPDDHAPAGGKQKNVDKQMTLVDVNQEADLEKGKESKALGSAEAREAGGIASVKKDKKKPGFLRKARKSVQTELYSKPVAFWGRSKNAAITTLTLTCICLVAAVISLSVVVVNGSSKDAAQGAGVAARAAPVVVASRRRELRDGLFALATDDDLHVSQALTPSPATLDACDDVTCTVSPANQVSVLSSVAIMNNVDLNVTGVTTSVMGAASVVPASVMPASVDILTEPRPMVAAFVTTTTMVPEVTASISAASAASSTVIETCGEWGDGAGPCARPYGRPNTTPDSWLSALASKAQAQASHMMPAGVNATSSFPIGVPVMGSPVASSVANLSLSSPIGAASILDVAECAPTTTIYVTQTASEPSTLTGTGERGTVYATSTSLSTHTITMPGPSGPLTATETAIWGNASGALITPNFTLTVKTTTVPPSAATLGSAVPSGVLSTSGGEKLTAPKPLGMGGSRSGNGIYCVVMLVALAALLI